MNVLLPDLAATEKLAARLARLLQPGDTVALEGPLGAGKTAFARALLRELGVTGDVPSPTFTLLQTYDTPRFTVAHFDLYRLKSADELDELGWEDSLESVVMLVEWPEHAENRLPENRLVLRFVLNAPDARRCEIEPFGAWKERMKDRA